MAPCDSNGLHQVRNTYLSIATELEPGSLAVVSFHPVRVLAVPLTSGIPRMTQALFRACASAWTLRLH